MQKASDKIWHCVESVVIGLGYEFVGAEYGQGENGNTLRVYIDKSGGILLDDCAKVSHQLSAVLDVEEPIQSKYTLEVSSPGIDRPLFKVRDYKQYRDRQVKIRTFVTVSGRRNFVGKLVAADDNEVHVEIDGETFAITLSGIERAQLISEL